MKRLAAAALAAVLASSALGPLPAAAVDGYTLASIVTYTADPASGWIGVKVEIDFKNTTPNPSGQTSGFDTIDLPVQAGASAVTASDGNGPLGASLALRGTVTVASITPRARVLFGQEIKFTVSYRLVDGAAPGLHVRSEVIEFPAWGFGTSSDVTIWIPSGYDVASDGDPLTIAPSGGQMLLRSGPIGDPTHWLALISAQRRPTYVTLTRTVTLASATIEVQILSWTTDETWGNHVAVIATSALSRLEAAAGLPYPRVGSLVIVESVPGVGGADEPSTSGAEIQVAFSASDFTLIHQLAHIWASEQVSGDRWIREGLASYLAGQVANQIGVTLPYVAADRTEALTADAFPLEHWGGSKTGATADAYGFAASWALFERIATTIGSGRLQQAFARWAAGLSAYDPADPPTPLIPGSTAPPMDSRRFLDQLAAVRSIDLTDAFRERVFDPSASTELDQRVTARSAYADLVARAGDWGTPLPIRQSLADWRFADAQAATEAALSWLADRDSLFEAIDRAGLTVPDRLRQQYQQQGGTQAAVDELAAERAVVDAFTAAHHRIDAPRSLVEQIGLAGGDDGSQLLARAAISFNDGDLRTASDLIAALEQRLDQAKIDGPLRIGVAAGLLLAGAVLIVVRRRRRRSHYTATG